MWNKASRLPWMMFACHRAFLCLDPICQACRSRCPRSIFASTPLMRLAGWCWHAFQNVSPTLGWQPVVDGVDIRVPSDGNIKFGPSGQVRPSAIASPLPLIPQRFFVHSLQRRFPARCFAYLPSKLVFLFSSCIPIHI